MKLLDGVMADATFSACHRYRYSLTRFWEEGRHVLWVMLNPSTATAEEDDPTIRRCQGFARSWGYSGIVVANLFALRTSDPRRLYRDHDPIGPDNDRRLGDMAASGGLGLVVAAWGVHGAYRARGGRVRAILENRRGQVHHLGLTQDGHPRHPLYLPKTTNPEVWK